MAEQKFVVRPETNNIDGKAFYRWLRDKIDVRYVDARYVGGNIVDKTCYYDIYHFRDTTIKVKRDKNSVTIKIFGQEDRIKSVKSDLEQITQLKLEVSKNG